MDIDTLRHSCAHVMASAVKHFYPQAKLGIGPSIKDGFYYDFELPVALTESDLRKIEKEMERIIEQGYSFYQEIWKKEDAEKFFSQQGERYKCELLKDIKEDTVSIYKHNDFVDLCRGPHVSTTKEIKYFKLLNISGAYWRGDQNNPQLTRIYGTAFFSAEELADFLKKQEEAKKRDHRILGKKLELFDIYYNDAGAGLVFYLPKGAEVRKVLEDWLIKEHRKRGYNLVYTPHIMEKHLWEKSGHWQYYRDYMYHIDKETQEFILKPMNCPGHILIYKSKVRSWRDLPLRLFELGTVYRYEKAGVLCGLLRVRGFTQDDAHIFCREEDLAEEIQSVLNFVVEAMRVFEFQDFHAELSTRPQDFIGEEEMWDKAETVLENSIKKNGLTYTVNQGEGAFYGPKIDIKLKDVLDREWQCATIQLDYNLPQRFDIVYHDKNGERKRPVMIHRVILGSLERFLATLIEHYGGKFPFWLAPTQVSILTVKDSGKEYGLQIKERLLQEGIRATIDFGPESLSNKIKYYEEQKVPYLVIVGQREEKEGKISLRGRGGKDLGILSLEDFLEILKKEVHH